MGLLNVVITGANRGIGFALTKRFFESGDYKVIACCRNPTQADDLQNLTNSANGKIEIYALDIADHASIDSFAKEVKSEVIDILINNAGIFGGDHQSIFDMDYDAWGDAFKINTIAPFMMAQAFIGNLKLAVQPKIITISSQMGALSNKGRGSCLPIFKSSRE